MSRSHKLVFLEESQDAEQDRIFGDFRGYCLSVVHKPDSILEIGPGYAPLFRKSSGYNVVTVDHADRSGLVEKYATLGVDTSPIEEIDFVWRGGTLTDLLAQHRFRYVFASHVIEHMVDLLRFFKDCEVLLQEGGEVILIIPDKRYCFDLFQPHTDTAEVLDHYYHSRSVHTLSALYREESQVAAHYDGINRIAWWQGPVSDLSFMRHDPRARLSSCIEAERAGAYVDAHEYFFTPSSFFLIVEELRFLGLIGLSISRLSRARGCEFLVTLEKSDRPPLPAGPFELLKKELALNTIRETIEASRKLVPLQAPLDRSVLCHE